MHPKLGDKMIDLLLTQIAFLHGNLPLASVILVWAIGNCSQSQSFAFVEKYKRKRDKIVLHLLQNSLFGSLDCCKETH